jgi:hypothetical protein
MERYYWGIMGFYRLYRSGMLILPFFFMGERSLDRECETM